LKDRTNDFSERISKVSNSLRSKWKRHNKSPYKTQSHT
jgi:hypothetical protein